MHDGMQYDPIQGQGHEPFKDGNLAILKSYLLCYLQWELPTDHWFLNYGTISTFDQAGYLAFILVLVSSDFELGRNVSCKESTSVLYGANFIITQPESRYVFYCPTKGGRLT